MRTDLVWRVLAHAVIVWLVCTGSTIAVFHRRLRLARYDEPW